ncbi:major facilitator superfamily domain-containing protein [Colletotrichum acutatum]|uniref:Major facilitator superfamily domain-containing protein n=1 Tax=Glomerella acutata TaxID=27357 RepID=A0AAD8U9T9_GLOAC|nr:major facilitator superfamily domain-containing protein [Colletotrichum acutatum]KAK1705480.1 major facilitator superfamily domain-containing protein [Colletotrichum acutatum]
MTTSNEPRRETKSSPPLCQEPPQASIAREVASDGGYGWIVTTSIAIIYAHSWGISAAYSVFLAHYIRSDTFPGTSALVYAAIGSLSIGITLVISPLATIMARELGTRPTMLLGAVLQSASLVCASFASRIWHLFLSQGLLFGVGMGLLFLPSYGIVAQWFTARRALANGVAIAGAGLGGLTYSLAVGAMMNRMGLLWAYRVLAIVSGVANGVSVLLIRTRYGETRAKRLALDTSLFKRVDYLLILGFGALSMLGYFILVFTLANYANVIGLDPSQASQVSAVFMLGQAVGRPVIGWLSDRFGRINITYLMTLVTGILSLVFWVNAKSFAALIAFALIVGLPAGVFWVNAAPVIAEVLGTENLASSLSLLWLMMVVPSTVSSPIALVIYMRTGTYLGAQLFTGFTFVAAAGCVFVLRRHQIRLRRKASGFTLDSFGEDGIGPMGSRMQQGFIGLSSWVVV